MGIISLINAGQILETATTPHPAATPLLRDYFTPNYEILIRGGHGAQPFTVTDEVKRYISEVAYEDNCDQFDRLTIKLENQIDGSGERSVLSILDSKLFAEGHILELMMGYGHSLFTVGASIVVKLTPEFPGDGSPTLTVEGYDLLYNTARRRPRGGVSYKGNRDSQIASIIGERNGFVIDAQDPRSYDNIQKTSGIYDRVQAKGMSDYEFLKKVADINGFDLFAKFDNEQKKFILFFRPPALRAQKEVFTFVYNEGEAPYVNSLLSFTPTLNAYDQGTDFELFYIKDKQIGGSRIKFSKQLDAATQAELKELQEHRFGAKMETPKPAGGDGVQVAFKAFGSSFKFPPHKRFKNEFEVRTAIQEFIKRQKENFVTGRGVVLGNEVLQSRQVHNLEGLGRQFSGKYYFTNVIHRMGRDATYLTEFTCRKVIDDVVVQAPPAFTISETDRRVSRFKGETTGAVPAAQITEAEL